MTPQSTALPVLQPVERPEIWLSFDDVARLESYADDAVALTRREIQLRVKEGRYVVRQSAAKAGNGRAVREVALSSLSPAGQRKYLAQMRDVADGLAAPLPAVIPPRPPVPERLVRGAAVPTLENGEVDVETLARAGRTADLDAFLKRTQAVAVCLDTLKGCDRRHGRAEAWRRAAQITGTPYRTLLRWVTEFKDGGAAALVPSYGESRGKYRALPEELRAAIRACYLTQQRPTIRQIMRNCVRPWCAENGILQPNRTTVARFVDKELFACERAAFRTGKREWEETIMIKVRRSPADLRPNDLWCADNRKCDVFVLAPDGTSVIRLWLTLYIDIATASFAGWCIREKPNSQSVALALRAGVLRRGCPRVLYHDNGKDFCANRFGGKEPWRVADPTDADVEKAVRWPALLPAEWSAEMGLLRLNHIGIERVIHALPYSSWSKPIESVFFAFHRDWENLMPGYCGMRPDRTPEKCKGEVRRRRLLTADQFVEVFRRFWLDWDANHRCGDRTRTPDEAYRQAEAELRRPPVAALDGLLLKCDKERSITADGIEVHGKRFMDENLALFVGERAGVVYDPDDLTHIVVFPRRYEGHKRLVVAEIPHAGWFEMSRANQIAQSCRRAQRDMLRVVATSDRKALVPDFADPSGAYRQAVENAEEFRAEQSAAETPEALSDAEALKHAQRADKAASQERSIAQDRADDEAADRIEQEARSNAQFRGA